MIQLSTIIVVALISIVIFNAERSWCIRPNIEQNINPDNQLSQYKETSSIVNEDKDDGKLSFSKFRYRKIQQLRIGQYELFMHRRIETQPCSLSQYVRTSYN